jgi:hypothetical protein
MSDQNRPPRKDRSDMTVGNHEKKHGLPPGYIRHPSTGRDVRSDMKMDTLRKKNSKNR